MRDTRSLELNSRDLELNSREVSRILNSWPYIACSVIFFPAALRAAELQLPRGVTHTEIAGAQLPSGVTHGDEVRTT